MKLFIVLITVFSIVSCSKEGYIPKLEKAQGNALGTTYSILYYSSKPVDLKKSLDSIFLAVNTSMSTYIPTSDISKINRGDTTIAVDKMFREVFELSREVHNTTQGYFDPTVGKLVNAWGFGPKKLKLKMTDIVVDSLKQYTGFSKVVLTETNRVKKQNRNITLDFNAIAKGYCIDRIAYFLDSKNIKDYLIELGGELVGKGIHLVKKTPWTVGIDHPNQKETRTLISTLSLKDRAMATSGNYRKFRIDSITRKKYVHTINPLTGYTQPSEILSVSVLANNCATADAYATAFMAMPLQKIKEVAKSQKELDIYVLYSVRDSIANYISDGFKEVLN